MDRTTSGPSAARPHIRPLRADRSAPLGANMPQPAAGYEGLRLPAAVLLDNVRSMYNVGAFFRAADGVGLEKVCLCGITAHPPKKAISKTVLGAEETVAWEHRWDGVQVAEGLRRGGFEIAAIETSAEAVDLFEWAESLLVISAAGRQPIARFGIRVNDAIGVNRGHGRTRNRSGGSARRRARADIGTAARDEKNHRRR